MKNSVFSYLSIVFFLGAVSCSPLKNSKVEEYLSLKFEVEPCSTNYVYSQTNVLAGSASYYKRGINLVVESSKLMNMHLGDPMVEPLPIRGAEVAVYDWTRELVQCGITDDNGQIKSLSGGDLLIPKTAGTYYVRVYSRINKILTYPGKPDFEMNVSVKKDIYTNELYYLEASAYNDGTNEAFATLTAYARQSDNLEVNGGAFNILNAIYSGYNYIRTNTGNVNTTCLNDKLNVYWKAGFNPFQYYYPDVDPSTLGSNSYYDQTTDSLYITGGQLGDIAIARTDHFGDYVIIHELGHHIENKCGALLSPGGTHAVLARIDPRLAWSEGWANYFSAKVLFNDIDILLPEFRTKALSNGLVNTNWTYFFASEGFSDSVQNVGNGTGFMFDLKKDGKNPDSWQIGSFYGIPFDRVDPSKYPGEGHFREGAITRGLFKLTTTCGVSGTCIDSVSGTPIGFDSIWKSMNKITGIGQSSYPFRSSETLMEILKSSFVTSGTWASGYKAFNEATTSEALHLFSDSAYSSGSGPVINKWVPYGTPLLTATSGACAKGVYYIEPRADDPVLTSTNSDQRYSNHFYTLDLSRFAGLDTLSVTFTKRNSSGTNTEFDVLLFEEDYFFNGDYSCNSITNGECTSYTASRTTNEYVVKADRRSGLIATKTLTGLSSLDTSKRYLLNIRAYTANKSINSVTAYEYTITSGAQTLCP